MPRPTFVRFNHGFNFADADQEARKNPAYWQEGIILEVTRHVINELAIQNLTQADLASRLGVKPAYISRVLRGHENLTLQTLAKIAFVLGKKWQFSLVGIAPLPSKDISPPITRATPPHLSP